MPSTLTLLRPVALAALIAAAGAAQAALTPVTSLAAFNAAVFLPGTDTFGTLSTIDSTASPLVGSTSTGASYGYTARSISNYFSGTSATPSEFFGVNTGTGPALSTNSWVDTIVFDTFTGGPIRGIGANVWGTDINGTPIDAVLQVTVTDSLGASLSQTLTNPGTGTFLGFVSNGLITSMVVTVQQGAVNAWPTVDNLVMAIPEPGTYALMLAGLAAVGFMARRRQG